MRSLKCRGGGGPAGGIGEWTWRTRARPAESERLSEGHQARVSERPSMAEVSSPVDVVPRRGATTARHLDSLGMWLYY